MISPRATTRNLQEALDSAASEWKPTGKLAKYNYHIPEGIKKAVLEAASSVQIPLGQRNMLYSALNRAMKSYSQFIHQKYWLVGRQRQRTQKRSFLSCRNG